MGKGDRQVPGKRESKLKLASGFRYINQVLEQFFFFFFFLLFLQLSFFTALHWVLVIACRIFNLLFSNWDL